MSRNPGIIDDMNEPRDCVYTSHGLRLHYVDWGNESAPPLLLIHGGGDHCRTRRGGSPAGACGNGGQEYRRQGPADVSRQPMHGESMAEARL